MSRMRRNAVALACAVWLAGHAQAMGFAEAYDAALQHDAQYRAAGHERESARLSVPIARSALLPSVAVNVSGSDVSGTREFPNSLNQQVTTRVEYTTPQASLGLRMPIFNYEALSRLNQAKAQSGVAESVFRVRALDLIDRLGAGYLQVLLAQEGRQLADSLVLALQQQLAQAEQRADSRRRHPGRRGADTGQCRSGAHAPGRGRGPGATGAAPVAAHHRSADGAAAPGSGRLRADAAAAPGPGRLAGARDEPEPDAAGTPNDRRGGQDGGAAPVFRASAEARPGGQRGAQRERVAEQPEPDLDLALDRPAAQHPAVQRRRGRRERQAGPGRSVPRRRRGPGREGEHHARGAAPAPGRHAGCAADRCVQGRCRLDRAGLAGHQPRAGAGPGDQPRRGRSAVTPLHGAARPCAIPHRLPDRPHAPDGAGRSCP